MLVHTWYKVVLHSFQADTVISSLLRQISQLVHPNATLLMAMIASLLSPVHYKSIAMIAAKTPTRRHWELFEAYKDRITRQMEPEEFLKYWAVSYDELAELCGRSKSTVSHWFSKGKHMREPSESDKRRLAEIHALWSQFENEPAHLREIWERGRKRKREE